MTVAEARCRVYWGSHGCDLQAGHPGVHCCGESCSEFETTGVVVEVDFADVEGRVRYAYDEAGADWSDWHDSTGFYMVPGYQT
jgi:hypothetical protein